jgi:hypothetical protein
MPAIEQVLINFIWGSFAAFWLCIIVSWLYCASVKYITSGDKSAESFACKVAKLSGHTSEVRVRVGEGYETVKIPKDGDVVGMLFWNSVLYALLGAILSALIQEGHTQAVFWGVSTILTIVVFLKSSKFIYNVGKKLKLHEEDKDAHK